MRKSFFIIIVAISSMLLFTACQPTISNQTTPLPPTPIPSTPELINTVSDEGCEEITPAEIKAKLSSREQMEVSEERPAKEEPASISSDTPEATQESINFPDAITPDTSNILSIGDPIPHSGEVIQADNLDRIANIARWGLGTATDVAMMPDNNTFIVGSANGIALYKLDSPDERPSWVAFPYPIRYETFYLSEDGNYLLLEYYDGEKFFDLQTLMFIEKDSAIIWVTPPHQTPLSYKGDVIIISEDGTKAFSGNIRLEETEEEITYPYQPKGSYRIDDAETGIELFALQDEIFYVSILTRYSPEGCEIGIFSFCGNAFDPVQNNAHFASFSNTGKTITLLYRPWGMSRSKSFGILRVYDANDGTLLKKVGTYDNPVLDFTYTPDGKHIIIVFVDGTIRILDIAANEFTYSASHLNQPISYLTYSHDGAQLLIKRPGIIEIRTTASGLLISTLEAETFMLSPTKDEFALGKEDGKIEIRALPTGKLLQSFDAHQDIVYSVTYSSDGQYLASSSQDCSIKMWDQSSGEFLHYFENNSADPYEIDSASRVFIYGMQFIPETNQLVGFGSWGTVSNWDVNNGTTNFFIESAPLEYYQGMMTLDPHYPEHFNVDTEDGVFFIDNAKYDLADGEYLGEYTPDVSAPDTCADNGAVSLDGTLLFTRGFDELEGQVCVLDAKTLELLQSIIVIPEEATNHDYFYWPHLSPDGQQLIVTTYSGIIYVFEIGTDE